MSSLSQAALVAGARCEMLLLRRALLDPWKVQAMTILADPEKSLVLIVDPTVQQACQLKSSIREATEVFFDRMTSAADAACVPRYFAVPSPNDQRDTWLSLPCERNKPRVFPVDPSRTVWTNGRLLNAMRDEMRDQLFLCGFWLDDVVSAAALEALALGFNAHLITDLTPAMDSANHKPALDRLNQYGVPPISLRGLLYEWAANCDDATVRQELMKHWEAQKAHERRGASA